MSSIRLPLHATVKVKIQFNIPHHPLIQHNHIFAKLHFIILIVFYTRDFLVASLFQLRKCSLIVKQGSSTLNVEHNKMQRTS